MNVRLRVYEYCYSNLGAICAKDLWHHHLYYFDFEDATVLLANQIHSALIIKTKFFKLLFLQTYVVKFYRHVMRASRVDF